MSRGYRSAIVAAFGFIAVYGFGLGYYHAALNYPQEQRYQPYRYATDKPLEADPAAARVSDAKPFEYRAPCYEPKGEDESDLCAQWRSANAAEDSAFWTKWGVWIGIVGSGLLLWQIALTRRAVEDTGLATEAMHKANEITALSVRPWLSVSMDVTGDIVSTGGIAKVNISYRIENVGETPAINVYSRAKIQIVPFGRGELGFWNSLISETMNHKYSGECIFPGQYRDDPYSLDLTEYFIKSQLTNEEFVEMRFWIWIYVSVSYQRHGSMNSEFYTSIRGRLAVSSADIIEALHDHGRIIRGPDMIHRLNWACTKVK